MQTLLTRWARPCGLLLLLLFVSAAQAQQVTGIVTDGSSGETLIGVNILVKGTSSGTTTDLDGNFSLTASPSDVLLISYTGYTTQEIAVGNQTTINVNLAPDAETLEEVVVVGYGREKKATLTGSVASIDSEQLTAVPVGNTANLLSGRVPGVITRQSSGLPGGENVNIRIRGASGGPLVLVDGIQMPFSRIDPNDIESITVLKDAAAAVYGARAGNGVLLVTTKRGTSGKPVISYNGSYTLQSAIAFNDHVDAGQYVELRREADLNDNNDLNATFSAEDEANFKAGAPGFEGGDWIDALIENNAPMHQHSLSVSGGSDQIKYYTSVGFLDQESYFRSRDYDYGRINARSNIDAQINNSLSFTLDLSYRQEEFNRAFVTGGSIANPGNGLDNLWTDLATAQPILPTELPDPSLGAAYSGFSQRNPLVLSRRDQLGTYDQIDNVFTGRLGLNYAVPFVPGLKLRAEMSIEKLNRGAKTFRNVIDLYSYDPETDSYTLEATNSGRLNVSDDQFRRTQLYPLVSLTYDKTFGDHSIKFLGLAEQQTRTFSILEASRGALLTASIPELFVGSTDFQFSNGGSGADIGRKSVVSRINYAYKDRYLLEGTFRADGNVRFAPSQRWGYFPSVSAGWVISEEGFFNKSSTIDFLKIRASYSQLGDDTANGLNGYDYLTGYGIQGGDPYLLGNNENFPRIRTLGLVNPALSWEVMTLTNFGVEANFFEGRLGVEFDIFRRERDGIIATNVEDLPSTFGANLPVENLNSQESSGFEAAINFQTRIGQVRIDLSPNISVVRSKWLEVKSQEDFEDPDQRRLQELDGQPLNRFVGYRADGLFMTQEEIDAHEADQDGNGNSTLRPGDIRYLDLNGDGEIDFRDQEVIGFSPGAVPEISGGLNFGIEYKGLRLSGLVQGATRFGFNVSGEARTPFGNGSIPFVYHYENRWQPDPNNPGVNINPNASLPAVSQAGSNSNNRTSDFWHRNARYLRLKNINLSYSLPAAVTSKLGVGNVSFYVAGENVLTVTNLGIYKNSFDPEGVGSVQRRVPITTTVAFGLRASL